LSNLSRMPNLKHLHLHRIGKKHIFDGLINIINEDREKGGRKPLETQEWLQ